MDIASLAQLLRETKEHNGEYEKTHANHQWSDWYAAYLNARFNGSSSDDAAATANRYMTDLLQILPQ